ncbi:NADH-quinone oxidoreductase subunit L [Deinococcus yavapaiensis]|nr:NADH-quinone oxidoreductase subunit L [Deinococcus yavapaiensis]
MPLFPLIGFAILILAGRSVKGTSAGWLASGAVLASFVVAALNFLNLGGQAHHETYWQWLPNMTGGNKNLSVGFYLDSLSSTLTLVVTGVGFLIHVFAIGYMDKDPRFARFFAYLNFFVALMLVLVLADSYPLMFVGWEGVGMASYLLIGFWFAGHHDRHAQDGINNSNAARKAFIMNRIGDLGFMLAMFLTFKAFGTLSLPQLFSGDLEGASRATVELICLFLLVGAIGKSAQLPLTTWLPDAMAGPTPVSALIHAATMVTAGVYLVARSHALFELAPTASTWVAVIGALTALYGAICALNQYDIKKILAFSTVSQLGYMFLAVGVGAYTAGIFHLVTHAFFKALLFLAAGSVIHGLHEEQDVRRMGGLAKKLPLTHAVSLIGVLAISGIPIFSGFFSKDAILLGAYESGNLVLYGVGLLVALMTAFYMGRWYFLVFRGAYRGKVAHPHEGGAVFAFPLVTLAVLATLGGLLSLPHFLGAPNYLGTFLGSVLPKHEGEPPLSTELLLVALAVGAGVLGLFLAYSRHRSQRLIDGPMRDASIHALYLDNLYDGAVGAPSRALAVAFDKMDRGVDGAVTGSAEVIAEPQGRAYSLWQSGYVRTYALSMTVGTALVMLYWAFRALGGMR